MVKISVIVPIYNVEQYLKHCIYSIQHQTFHNIEIILVDDGATDRCPEICDQLASQDERIKVIHKPNGGLSDARNAGIAMATGDLVAFVDSDDWVSPYYLEDMYKAMEQSESDIVECDIIRTDKVDCSEKHNVSFAVKSYATDSALKLLILDNVFHQYVWNKLYKREVISNILFEYGKCNEDEFWTYQVFGKAKKIAKIDTPLYYYFQRSGSIMGVGYQVKRLDAIDAKLTRQVYIQKNYPELSGIALANLAGSMIYAGQMSMKYLNTEDKHTALKKLRRNYLTLRKYKNIEFDTTKKQKLWLKAAFLSFTGVCRLRNFLKIGL